MLPCLDGFDIMGSLFGGRLRGDGYNSENIIILIAISTMVCVHLLPFRPSLITWLARSTVGGVLAALLRAFAAFFLHCVEQYFELLAAFRNS